MKPNLKIVSVDRVDNYLKIKIQNNGCFNAVNVKIETCVVNKDYTYHFKIDREDFLILPPKKGKNNTSYFRYFKIDSLSDSAKKYTDYDSIIRGLVSSENQYILRIRLHACHEYSGFGKAFENKFVCTNGSFEKIKKMPSPNNTRS